jgi:hypothetical protein
MLHLTKLAVGVRDVPHLRALQAERATRRPPLRHLTRMQPKRRDEILDGGSMFWVVTGALCVRQRIIDLREDRREDGSACCAIVLDPELVPVLARTVKPFQGWRYLAPSSAPPDLTTMQPVAGMDRLPPKLMHELRELCLI